MRPSAKFVISVIVVAIVCLLLSYAGIFQYIAMPSSIQLLLQVIGIAIIVLGTSACGMYYLNKSIDQSNQA